MFNLTGYPFAVWSVEQLKELIQTTLANVVSYLYPTADTEIYVLTVSGGVVRKVALSNLMIAPEGETVYIQAGSGVASGAGDLLINAGNDGNGFGAGRLTITPGNDSSYGGGAGHCFITGGAGETSGISGDLTLSGGSAVGDGDISGGNVNITPGTHNGSGALGHILLQNVPSSDPHVVGAIWNSSGTLKLSAG